ncbi:MAG: DUF4124 domain-containing protein [Thermodesulfobacteriota bacterium]
MVKKLVPLLFTVLLVLTSHMFVEAAELYQWTDKNGNVHATDDILLVPLKYRSKVKVYESIHIEEEPPRMLDEVAPSIEPGYREDLYGDYPLEWWEEEFDLKNEEVTDLGKTVSDSRRYIEIFENGRRYGQVFSQDEVQTYEDYIDDLPYMEERLEELKAELEELRRRATIYGVPRSIRE